MARPGIGLKFWPLECPSQPLHKHRATGTTWTRRVLALCPALRLRDSGENRTETPELRPSSAQMSMRPRQVLPREMMLVAVCAVRRHKGPCTQKPLLAHTLPQLQCRPPLTTQSLGDIPARPMSGAVRSLRGSHLGSGISISHLPAVGR